MTTPRPTALAIADMKLWTCNRCGTHEYPFAFSATKAPSYCETPGCRSWELPRGTTATFRQTAIVLPMGGTLTAPDAPWANPDVPVPAVGQTLHIPSRTEADRRDRVHVVGYSLEAGALAALCWSDEKQAVVPVAASDLPRRPAEPRTYSRDEQRAMTDEELKAAQQAAQDLSNAAAAWAYCCPEGFADTKPWQAAWGQFHAESRRRQSNATRAKNAGKNTQNAIAPGTFAVGEQVEVHAFGRWYPGEVVAVARTRVTVRYTTRTTGNTFEKTVNAAKVRKAS